MSRKLPIVLDGGTGFLKAGFAGQNVPQLDFPSIVGRPVLRAEEKGDEKIVIEDVMYGDEAAAARNMLQISYPMENGIVKNWEDMQLLWNYTFKKLGFRNLDTDFADRDIMLTEPPGNPDKNKEKMYEIMFERYNFGSAFVAIQAVLALYSQGIQSGVVIDSGDGVTHIVPVTDSFVDPLLIERLDVAGRVVTRNLISLLLRRGYALNRSADFETVRQIKEKLCYVSYDLQLDKQLSEETTALMESYTLPDGRVIRMGSERFEAPECLFQPHLVDCEQPGIAEMLFDMIMTKAEMDNRVDLFRHIYLSGGSSMFPGFPERLKRELKQLWLTRILRGDPTRLNNFVVKVQGLALRRHMVFRGATLLAKLVAEQGKRFLPRELWQEEGVRAVKSFTLFTEAEDKKKKKGGTREGRR